MEDKSRSKSESNKKRTHARAKSSRNPSRFFPAPIPGQSNLQNNSRKTTRARRYRKISLSAHSISPGQMTCKAGPFARTNSNPRRGAAGRISGDYLGRGISALARGVRCAGCSRAWAILEVVGLGWLFRTCCWFLEGGRVNCQRLGSRNWIPKSLFTNALTSDRPCTGTPMAHLHPKRF